MGRLVSDQCERGVKVARFTGAAKTTFQTRREFKGSVLGQVGDVLELLDPLNNVRAEFDGRAERKELCASGFLSAQGNAKARTYCRRDA